ncbi:growth/differentiation factor 15 [Tenrec ecaudatus]|uniref:growth/differentiation factor 15 n=1 Tax=Tenrec ecaudatus TaxID=94439 RepID=UPI003F5A0C8A
MCWPGPTPPHPSPMLLLLLLLLLLPPPQGTVSSVPEPSPGLSEFPDALRGLDASRLQEMRKSYEALMDQLRINQSRTDSSLDGRTGSVIRILTPKVRPAPRGQVQLRIPLAALPAGRRAALRLHRALLRLSPAASSPRDVTRPLRRLLARGGPPRPVLLLRLRPPARVPARAAPRSARLELHLRPRAARARRSARPPSAENCAARAGTCCGVRSRRVTLAELGWADWVLAPRELDVRACVGACPPRFRPASAYTRIKSRLHDLDPDAAPAPCCVPASFEPVVLMHQDSDGRVALTPYDDILVKDCHCA